MAERALLVPGMEHRAGCTLVYTAPDFPTAYNVVELIAVLAVLGTLLPRPPPELTRAMRKQYSVAGTTSVRALRRRWQANPAGDTNLTATAPKQTSAS
ncbi:MULTISPECIES: hypothetical protein [unclassified Amycolatopsis]|uniref:hypothetical protein n=1 Tax=unclassified Amycolatopsis TaxID=2618356 RepID=UPI003453A08B